MSIGNSTTGTVRSNADNDNTSKKRRKLNPKQEYVDSLWKQVSNYQSANQLGRIDATIRQIDVTEQEIDQLHRELVNEMDWSNNEEGIESFALPNLYIHKEFYRWTFGHVLLY